MRIHTTLAGLMGGLLLAVGMPASASDGSTQPATEETSDTVKVTVNLPGGRKVVVDQPAQPSRVENTGQGDRVEKTLPDGSKMSYSNGSGNTKAARRKNNRSKSGSSSTAKKPATTTTTTTTQTTPQTRQPVPTVGTPRYEDDGATGGQDVRFFDAGISAMVVGRTVFIWGAELIQSTEDFELVEGERLEFNGAIVRQERNENTGGQTLSSADQLYAPLKLEYDPDTTVTLTLHSRAANPEQPAREVRTWTFRVR